MTDISNSADIIYSRDIIDRIDELETEYDDPGQAFLQGEPDDEIREEYRILTALREEAEPYAPDWRYGATLIRDDYFEEYAKQLAEDLGVAPVSDEWPASHIDWEAAADALKQDYVEVDYDGVTYWIR